MNGSYLQERVTDHQGSVLTDDGLGHYLMDIFSIAQRLENPKVAMVYPDRLPDFMSYAQDTLARDKKIEANLTFVLKALCSGKAERRKLRKIMVSGCGPLWGRIQHRVPTTVREAAKICRRHDVLAREYYRLLCMEERHMALWEKNDFLTVIQMLANQLAMPGLPYEGIILEFMARFSQRFPRARRLEKIIHRWFRRKAAPPKKSPVAPAAIIPMIYPEPPSLAA